MTRAALKTVGFTVCRAGLGAMFVWSAWGKIADPGLFADTVMKYEFLPEAAVGLFALTLPMVELLTGLALLFTARTREAALLAGGMLVMFLVALAWAFARGLEISCGCFGGSGAGGRADIAWAMARDVALLAPAAWLFRRGRRGWLWTPRASVVAALAVAAALPAAALTASSGPVAPGEWNGVFTNVTATAARDHRPMVFLFSSQGCTFCARMKRALDGGAFRLWREDRAPLMAAVTAYKDGTDADNVFQYKTFVTNVFGTSPEFPQLGVWWPKADGTTNAVIFSGRRGQMGVKSRKLLVEEAMAALDAALGTEAGRRTAADFVKAAGKRIAVAADGPGKALMNPKDGALPEGGTVALTAKAGAGAAFVSWRAPDGSLAGWSEALTVRGDMAEGRYTARFIRRADCVPPVLLSPASTSLCVRAHAKFRYAVKVDEACRPVKFSAAGLPPGLKIGAATGVIAGVPGIAGTNDVTVTVAGNDPARTAVKVKLALEVQPPDAE